MTKDQSVDLINLQSALKVYSLTFHKAVQIAPEGPAAKPQISTAKFKQSWDWTLIHLQVWTQQNPAGADDLLLHNGTGVDCIHNVFQNQPGKLQPCIVSVARTLGRGPLRDCWEICCFKQRISQMQVSLLTLG